MRVRVPLLLELNARPGLAIQIANQDGLYGRLKKIDQGPPRMFETPETRMSLGHGDLWGFGVMRKREVKDGQTH